MREKCSITANREIKNQQKHSNYYSTEGKTLSLLTCLEEGVDIHTDQDRAFYEDGQFIRNRARFIDTQNKKKIVDAHLNQ